MKQHQLSAIFPAMPDDEYESLKAHISAHGQQSAIATFDGQVLDGWHRYRACEELGLEPKLREMPKATDALAFVLGQNLNRRHLDSSQRAILAGKIANMNHGGDRKTEPKNQGASLPLDPQISVVDAAKKLNVSPRSVKDARVVLEDKKQAAKVMAGEKTVSAAAKEIRAKKEAAKEVHRDATGYAIPEKILPLWNRRGEVKDVLDAISHARSVLRKVMERIKDDDADPLYAPANVSGAYGDLNDAWTKIGMAMPYAVCPSCQGRAPDACKVCKGRAFISRHTFEHAFPPELIAIREKSCVK